MSDQLLAEFAELRADRDRLGARVVELEGALESAIYLAEDKWPVAARTLRARFLAAAGEGEDRA
jgi:hypothetical protein